MCWVVGHAEWGGRSSRYAGSETGGVLGLFLSDDRNVALALVYLYLYANLRLSGAWWVVVRRGAREYRMDVICTLDH